MFMHVDIQTTLDCTCLSFIPIVQTHRAINSGPLPGRRANLVHPHLIETTCAAFPRKGWSECFAKVIEKELSLKPWCHTSTFERPNWMAGVQSNFATDVRGNQVMKKFD